MASGLSAAEFDAGATLDRRDVSLPVLLRLAGRRCVVVGGGATAARRARALRDAGAEVTVVAPRIDDAIGPLGVTLRRREVEADDVAGAFLVVVATDNPAVNDQSAAWAAAAGALINRADDPAAGDLTVMAYAQDRGLTVAVDTGGASASAAGAIRDELASRLDPAWPEVLAAARPWRAWLQDHVPDPAVRRSRLRRLTDEKAKSVFRESGAEALAEHLSRVANGR
ncbi:MAG: NAD(P)-dependent oxidoreductase [Planctomycetota bacterium]